MNESNEGKKFTRLGNYSIERCLTQIQYLQVFLIIDTYGASIGWNRYFPDFSIYRYQNLTIGSNTWNARLLHVRHWLVWVINPSLNWQSAHTVSASSIWKKTVASWIFCKKSDLVELYCICWIFGCSWTVHNSFFGRNKKHYCNSAYITCDLMLGWIKNYI